ncbi:phosphate ABC transporter permease subunit PstC [Streptomyces europaeiscabiei]|uniref:Phosphate transport system permease protein n=1 Tax=Streptomyces europaeiscabiei TaxID=146819 RepID=A0AAJ2PXJ0_9ACTN|nr:MULTISPECIES: phosphate ABC transporter permease subunit PstC [Streptomyces]KFG02708.1 phosphate ABC transporter permease [Streptomyces scabiei]MDX3135382.1 phosphate ABC transporter permease subunit PstC [Streptomyces europaeiscabiei]MDX3584578.1 phosphate ABC transporter permease subunit PstC [Streptomyces europaeiscabiei]MDX3618596.1 phosphate ABC transporter permease subunit PstC [Streptomyces europaeiscabiei]MDX3635734.1 phosphate ABC transporter permease subunit PstC [Streptomyces eur
MDISTKDTPAPPTPPSSVNVEEKRAARGATRVGDRVFLGLSRGSGIFLLALMAAIAVFLSYRAALAISEDEANFFTTFEWNPTAAPPVFGIAVLAFGTIVSSVIAMAIAVPVAVGIALFITHYAPRRLGGPIAYVIDLLAAVPSIVYGLWGALVLVPQLDGLYGWLNDYLGWTGIFEWQGGAPRSMLTVGILLAIMILPIITNVSREVFRQVPRMHEEAALALGATRWEVIRMAVLPFGRSGVISASMLGLGRALGETMAVAMVLSSSFEINLSLLDPGGGTFAQNIASKFSEATEIGRDALIASGLVLFVITLLVNGGARLIIARRKEFSGANA